LSQGSAQAPQRNPIVVWRLLDGKPGHENQSLGLVNALSAMTPVQSHDIEVTGGVRAGLAWLTGRCPVARGLPAPDLLIGAGHGTHLHLLACRRAHGGRAVVLMRPSLPLRWFDLCVVPEHDAVKPRDNVLVTRGALNTLSPGGDKDAGAGLIMIGGPSTHYAWDDEALAEQLRDIAGRDPRRWTVTTSRRTPASTLALLQGLTGENVRLVPFVETAPGWAHAQLRGAAVAWVTEDSVSMVYEALTAGAACGLLPVPARGTSRVRGGVQRLLADGMVTSFADWQTGKPLLPPAQPLDEAARCAQWILSEWFGD
jgi:mitochondrial fission protein ELM1